MPAVPDRVQHASSGVDIRRATEEDLPRLVSLERACFSTWYYRDHQFREPQFRDYLHRPGSILLVAERASSVVGYASGSSTARRSGPSVRLDSIAVLPSSQGQGVGGWLLLRFLQMARRRQRRTVILEVAMANELAIHFFSERGFRRARHLSSHYGAGIDGVRMQCRL